MQPKSSQTSRKIVRGLLFSLLVVVASFWISRHVSAALPFLSPPPPPNPCIDQNFICLGGGSRKFGNITVILPNGFFAEGVHVYCDSSASIPVTTPPTNVTLASLPVFCGFWSGAGPVLDLLRPISIVFPYDVSLSPSAINSLKGHCSITTD